ncbi:MAG: UvrB/UvrC motif-containing protein, partial [Bacteroidetes bacterium]|nr:UvrB/UvrC motif-containing protein [Bacteroidota bacterium]
IELPKTRKSKSQYAEFTESQLNEMLKVAIEKENYEEASHLRDELSKRNLE